jgi:3-deoxy-D-manno-octulosonic-acid transferase
VSGIPETTEVVRTPGDDPAEPATEAGQEAPAGGPGRRRRRLVAVLVGTLALAALGFVLVAALLTSTTTDALDPDSAGPTGSRALARVLADHGVSVDIARGVDALADAGVDADTTVVVTATTDTGYRVARERYPGHRVEFYPPDVSWIVRDALDRLRPDLVVLVESEFWPNFLTAVSQRSASRFRRGGRLTRGLLSAIARFCVQLPVHADRFASLGLPADHVVVTGNLKFDNVPILADRRRSDAYARLLGATDGRPLFVAGSTHPPEERWMGQTVRRVRA